LCFQGLMPVYRVFDSGYQVGVETLQYCILPLHICQCWAIRKFHTDAECEASSKRGVW
jgi:hypothetical protein